MDQDSYSSVRNQQGSVSEDRNDKDGSKQKERREGGYRGPGIEVSNKAIAGPCDSDLLGLYYFHIMFGEKASLSSLARLARSARWWPLSDRHRLDV